MYQIIVNPASRSGKGLSIWKEVIEPVLLKDGISYCAHFSEKRSDACRLAAQITRNHPLQDPPIKLIVLGGDGTINDVLQGICDFSRVIIGYIPTGSSNDLARDLNFPKDPLTMLRLILEDKHRITMDLGKVTCENGTPHYFAVSCGLGYDAAVCEETFRSNAKVWFNRIGLGKLVYLGIALKQIFSTRFTTAKLTLDNQTAVQIPKMLFIATMIHRYEGGGFMFCPKADATDNCFDLCSVGDLSKLIVLLALPTAFFGKHYLVKGIKPYRGTQICIETSTPVWVHTDGEVVGNCRKISISSVPKAIQMIVPPTL